MNRAETQFTLERFFVRIAGATVADATLAKTYIEALRGYLDELEAEFEPIDVWSVEEYEHVCEFTHNNFQWLANSSVASGALADAYELLSTHKAFLGDNGLLPEYLAQRPNPSFRWTADGAAEFTR